MSLAQRLQSIETKRARLLDRADAMDPSRLTAHPRPGKWSILEIIEHLVLAESDVFQDPAKLEAMTPRRRKLKHRIRYPIVMLVLRYDIPVQVPSQAMRPNGTRSLADLRAQWEASHAGLRAWVTGSDPARLEQPLFYHPIAGPLTTAQSLAMLEVHLDRHIRQIERLERLLDNAAER